MLDMAESTACLADKATLFEEESELLINQE